jgi:hypothetical protein
VHEQVQNLARDPFVVVPDNQFHEMIVQCNASLSVEHTGTWRFTDDVPRDDIILCVRNDAIHRAFRGLLQAAVISSYWNVCHKLGINERLVDANDLCLGIVQGGAKDQPPAGSIQGRLSFNERGRSLNHETRFSCSRASRVRATVLNEGTFTGFTCHTCSQ